MIFISNMWIIYAIGSVLFAALTAITFHHYGQEHNSTTDYLIGISGSYTKENTESTIV